MKFGCFEFWMLGYKNDPPFWNGPIIYKPFQATTRLCPTSLQLCKEAHNFTSSYIAIKRCQ